jgi:hypothetical protein
VFFLLTCILPVFAQFTIRSFCAWQNERLAEPIIEAVEAYKVENGSYPYRLSELVPNYLEEHEIPHKGCFFTPIFDREFHIILANCEFASEQYLSLYVIGYPISAYYFETNEWEVLDFSIHSCGLIEGLS